MPPCAGVCEYYLAVFAPAACISPTCAAPVTVVARAAGDAAPLMFSWSDIAGAVASVAADFGGAAAAVASVPVELFLAPYASSSGVDVALAVESCGPALPALFACDPMASGCANPYMPGPGDASAQNDTAAPGQRGYPIGIASVAISQTPASAVFAAVRRPAGIAPLQSPRQQQHAPDFFIHASALPSALWLAAGAGATVITPLTPPAASPRISIAWPPASLVAGGPAGGGGPAPAAAAVIYTVYVATPSFAACAAAGGPWLPTTACGLARWAAACAGSAGTPAPAAGGGWVVAVPARDATTAVADLPITGAGGAPLPLEVAVVATCDATCWAASLPAPQAAVGDQSTAWPIAATAVPVPASGGGGRAAGYSGASVGIAAVAALLAAGAGAMLTRRYCRRSAPALRSAGGLAYLRLDGDAVGAASTRARVAQLKQSGSRTQRGGSFDDEM